MVNKYSPGGRKSEYFRVSIREGKKVRHFHVCGGSVKARLAQYRANKLQDMIDRGAGLGEIMAAINDYAGGSK